MAGRRTKVASLSETSSAGGNTFGVRFTSTDAHTATGTFPPYLGIPPFSASRMSAAATGQKLRSSCYARFVLSTCKSAELGK